MFLGRGRYLTLFDLTRSYKKATTASCPKALAVACVR